MKDVIFPMSLNQSLRPSELDFHCRSFVSSFFGFDIEINFNNIGFEVTYARLKDDKREIS